MQRRARFRRDPTNLDFQLTLRDQEILRHVRRHRFLNSRQIASLISGSSQNILRRLQRLYHHGFLDRPKSQVRYFSEDGMKPLVYGLGRAGARAMESFVGYACSPDNRNVRQLYLQHTLMVADVAVAFERSCGGGKKFQFVDPSELTAENGKGTDIRWSTTVTRRGQRYRVGVIPDRVFALQSRANGERVLYFVEADRGTMPVARSSISRSSLLRKFLAYESTWQQGIHRQKFGCERFRVLVVTSTQSRVDAAVEACRQLPRGRGLFLFTDARAFNESVDALAHPWRNVAGGIETISS